MSALERPVDDGVCAAVPGDRRSCETAEDGGIFDFYPVFRYKSYMTESRSFTRLSIRTKLIAAFLTIGLIPLIVVGGFSLFTSTRAIQNLAITQVSDARDALVHAEKDLRLLSHSSALITFVDFYPGNVVGKTNLDRMLSSTLRGFAQGNAIYRQVLLSNRQGEQLYRVRRHGNGLDTQGPDPSRDLGREDFFWKTLDSRRGEIIITSSAIKEDNQDDAEPTLSYSTAIYDRGHQQKGILTLQVLIKDLAILARSAETALGNTYLLDRQGRFLYNIDAIEQRAVQGGFPGKLGQSATQQILSGTEGLITSEKDRIIGYAPIFTGIGGAEQFWVLAIDLSRTFVFSPVRRFLLFFGIMVLSLTVIGIVFGITASHHFTMPIVKLHRGAQMVAAGKFDQPIEVRTRDEIEELAVQFNLMARQLKTSREQLTKWNEELKKEVEKRTAQLLQAEKMAALGGLSAGIAHEIGNPLASMKTNIQILEENLGKDHRHHRFLQRILKEIDRLSHFFKTFSSFARPAKPRITVCDIRRVIREVILFMKKEAEARGITFRENFDEHVPPVMADFQRMQQVFFNLFLNAMQAIPGRGTITVGVSTNPEAQQNGPDSETVIVTVKDTGPGIPAELGPKIFEPFYTTKPTGTGLGLSIVHQIVTENGGSISLQSSPGEGTMFVMSLRAAEAAAPITKTV
jgi:signal transduction histidine kinase